MVVNIFKYTAKIHLFISIGPRVFFFLYMKIKLITISYEVRLIYYVINHSPNRKRDSKHKTGLSLFPLGSFYNLSKQKALELFQAGSDSHSSKNVAELIDQSMNGPQQTRCLCNVTKRKKKNLHGHYCTQ